MEHGGLRGDQGLYGSVFGKGGHDQIRELRPTVTDMDTMKINRKGR
ncbi:hypothetical protein HRW14_16540 [Streptomyces lunaelactis]|nr:hypothetical protein [Streptomyces lunaelactis]NUK51851.1 hypothetical protein [Streptomyces lunaelactis]NUK64137.1 hypothetical protein [Streptomyces lunaelactis]